MRLLGPERSARAGGAGERVSPGSGSTAAGQEKEIPDDPLKGTPQSLSLHQKHGLIINDLMHIRQMHSEAPLLDSCNIARKIPVITTLKE